MRTWVARSWKLFVAAAAVLGAVSFFEPFFAVGSGDISIPVSAFRVMAGFDDAAQLLPVMREAPEPQRSTLLARWNDMIQHEAVGPDLRPQPSRIPYFYLSVATLLLVAAVALVRRELSFFAALATVGAGLCALWGWSREVLLLRHAAETAERVITLASGGTLLGVVGLIALVVGIGALLWPDPGGFWPPRTISVLVARGEAPVEIEMPTSAANAAVPTATLRVRTPRDDKRES
jgi:hypothetical protein